jgi:hypothetical protein
VLRAWYALTALVVLVALAIQIPITATATGGRFDTPVERVANLFTFFTILTNTLVGITAAHLALRPGEASLPWRVARLDALLGIVVTGSVYHALLADLYVLTGAEAFANQLFHTVVPVLAVVGWALFGPRGLIGPVVVACSVVYPLVWLAFTLVRGALIDYYPYPFVDVTRLGYAQVALNCLGITVLFLALAAVAAGLDRVLAARAARRPVPGSGA